MTWHLMILSKMIRASADSYGCSAWRPRSRGEPDKLGWACCLVCACVCWCVHGFLTRQRQYCIFHSSCRLIGCDICLCRTLPSFLPSPLLFTPLSSLFSFHLCSSPHSLSFLISSSLHVVKMRFYNNNNLSGQKTALLIWVCVCVVFVVNE